MSSSFWVLFFFIGWPLSGGNGAAITNDNRPPFPPCRDGCFTEESVRNIEHLRGECVNEDLEKPADDIESNLEDTATLEAVWEEEDLDEEDDNQVFDEGNCISEQSQGAGVVQKMVHKFSRRGSKFIPPLFRRNTVARCTDVANDVKQQKHNLFRRSSDQHIIWDDSVSGADAATDNEFSSLMERVSDLNEPKVTNMQDEASLTRGSPSRKSLPAGALKSYMRGTKASIMKTREGSPPHTFDNSSPSVSPALGSKGKTSPGNSQVKTSHSDRSDTKPKSHGPHIQNSVTARRKKVVNMKPNIPPVLLKGANRDSSQVATVSSKVFQNNADETVSSEERTSSCKEGISSVTGDAQSQSHIFEISQDSRLCRTQCQEKCNSCSLVDLWFTIWYVEFNKK